MRRTFVAVAAAGLLAVGCATGGDTSSACEAAEERLSRAQTELDMASEAVDSFSGSNKELEKSREWKVLQAALKERAAAADEFSQSC